MTIQLSPSGTPNIVKFSTTASPAVAGEVAMDTTTGRLRLYSGGVKSVAFTDEIPDVLNDLTDVSISGTRRYDALRWDSVNSLWRNVPESDWYIVDPTDPTDATYNTIQDAVNASNSGGHTNYNPAVIIVKNGYNAAGSPEFSYYKEDITLTRPTILRADYKHPRAFSGIPIYGTLTITPATAGRIFFVEGFRFNQKGITPPGAGNNVLVLNNGGGSASMFFRDCRFINERTNVGSQTVILSNLTNAANVLFDRCYVGSAGWTTNKNDLIRINGGSPLIFEGCTIVVNDGADTANNAGHRFLYINAAGAGTTGHGFLNCYIVGRMYMGATGAGVVMEWNQWLVYQNDAHAEWASTATLSALRLEHTTISVESTAYTRTEWLIRNGSAVPRLYMGNCHYDNEVEPINTTMLGYIDLNPKDALGGKPTKYAGHDESFATFIRTVDGWIYPTAPVTGDILQYDGGSSPKGWKPTSVSAFAAGMKLGELQDVNDGASGMGANDAGKHLVWNNASSEWQALYRKSVTASSTPTTASDSANGFMQGSTWWNMARGIVYGCLDATTSNAVWEVIGNYPSTFVVSKEKGSKYSTVQSAITAAEAKLSAASITDAVIFIGPGEYSENITVTHGAVTLVGLGAGVDNEIVQYDRFPVKITGAVSLAPVNGNADQSYLRFYGIAFDNTAASTASTVTVNCSLKCQIAFENCAIYRSPSALSSGKCFNLTSAGGSGTGLMLNRCLIYGTSTASGVLVDEGGTSGCDVYAVDTRFVKIYTSGSNALMNLRTSTSVFSFDRCFFQYDASAGCIRFLASGGSTLSLRRCRFSGVNAVVYASSGTHEVGTIMNEYDVSGSVCSCVSTGATVNWKYAFHAFLNSDSFTQGSNTINLTAYDTIGTVV